MQIFSQLPKRAITFIFHTKFVTAIVFVVPDTSENRDYQYSNLVAIIADINFMRNNYETPLRFEQCKDLWQNTSVDGKIVMQDWLFNNKNFFLICCRERERERRENIDISNVFKWTIMIWNNFHLHKFGFLFLFERQVGCFYRNEGGSKRMFSYLRLCV